MKRLLEKVVMFQLKIKISIEDSRKDRRKISEAVGIARTSGINLDKLISLLTLLYQEDD